MIPVRDNSGNFHETVAIYDNSGREIVEVRDNQGRLLFKNWSEISSVPPLHFTSRGGHLLDYRIYGNTVQDGTPTPENPVEVQGCGVRTGNLFDVSTAEDTEYYINNNGELTVGSSGDRFIVQKINATPLTNYTFSWGDAILGTLNNPPYIRVSEYANTQFLGRYLFKCTDYTNKTFTVKTGQYTTALDIRYDSSTSLRRQTITNLMLNAGSTVPPYEPYGYKIPVTVSDGTNSITTPVYLGSEPLHKIGDYADYVDYKRGVVVRRIKKVVFTGNETFLKNDSRNPDNYLYYQTGYRANEYCFCTHLVNMGTLSPNKAGVFNGNAVLYLNFGSAIMGAQPSRNTVAGLKEYLAAQYAAGTPVTIWYVLAEPEEEPLENLLPIQTIKGSDVLTVDTTVQPSNIWIKGKIKAIN